MSHVDATADPESDVVLLASSLDRLSWLRGEGFVSAGSVLQGFRQKWEASHANEAVHPKVALRSFQWRPEERSLELTTADTDWLETSTFHLALRELTYLETELVADVKDRGLFRMPNLLTAHVLVVLADGNVVAVRRSEDVRFHPSRWSVSFEEQIEPEDLRSADPLQTAVTRGLCEEFRLDAALVQSVRPLGLALEPRIVNPALLARAEVGLSSKEMTELAGRAPCDEWDRFEILDPGAFPKGLLHPTSRLRVRENGQYRVRRDS